MFEKASRMKLRFSSSKGELTVEQLWDLPLQSKTGFDLDTLARAINRELRTLEDDSFVDTPRSNPRKIQLELSLEIVKRIIDVKQTENRQALNAADQRERRKRLEEVLHIRTQQELLSKSPAEIQAMLDAMDK